MTPLARKTPHLSVVDGRVKTTSRDVAANFGKRHDNVIQAINKLDCSDNFRLLNFKESSYDNEQGKSQPMVEMTRDGFVFLAMGFTGANAAQFKEAYIEAFNRMEAELLQERRMPSNLVNMATYLSNAVQEIRSGNVYPVDLDDIDCFIQGVNECSKAFHEALNQLDLTVTTLDRVMNKYRGV